MMFKDCDNLRETDGVKRYYCRLNPTVFFNDDVLDVCYCKGKKQYSKDELREHFVKKYCQQYSGDLCPSGDCFECHIDMFIDSLED